MTKTSWAIAVVGVVWWLLMAALLGWGQEKHREHHLDAHHYIQIFERGKLLMNIFADEVVVEPNGYVAFYLNDGLIVAIVPDSGLVWKESQGTK